ncbi:chemotaxis protein CheD [Amaricoccus tamworthensis]|uniref:chemotaxis protein CheD n=1 Tax=Amaricoccus tamworthensis TaxID=57002 RepID=UPI003C7CF31F
MSTAVRMDDPPLKLIHVIQGEFAVADDDDAVLTTVLGSCVAACLRDPVTGVGGMNHFLLPDSKSNSSDQVIYGAQSMELLINALLRAGASKERLEAKIFGGARMVAGLSDIGQNNGEFARRFLRNEGIKCVGESIGGNKARRIRFWPRSGLARQMLLGAAADVAPVVPPKPKPALGNDVELF